VALQGEGGDDGGVFQRVDDDVVAFAELEALSDHGDAVGDRGTKPISSVATPQRAAMRAWALATSCSMAVRPGMPEDLSSA
jgi:hypothetical protein